jgi:UDP-N-acetylmuramoyl-tripeptide--D-alanyl-D-alanine ligase
VTRGLRLTAADVAAACEGRILAGDPACQLPSFSIDTRTLRPGDTFIALTGPRFDGHAFVASAAARGARAVIIAAPAALDSLAGLDTVVVLVQDTLLALQALARHVRRASHAQVVAITGSTGKTTTKEAIAALLATRFTTLKNPGNLNNHIGLPLSLLQLQDGAEVAVVELGMNHVGEISKLVEIAEPDVRVWTNVGTAHLEYFGSVDALADAKAEILERASAETRLVANADDPRIMTRIAAFPGRAITFGFAATADVRAEEVVDRGVEGQDAVLRVPAGRLAVSTRLPGRGHLANILAATAVALQFGLSSDAIARTVASLAPAAHRGEVLRLSRGIRVLDDCYNSSPGALLPALAALRATNVEGRRLAVLGEMLELGGHADALHRECGRAAAHAGLDTLVTVGGDPARALGDAAREAGLPAGAVVHVADSAAAADRAVALLKEGDLLLVKGSRGVRLEVVVERLKREFA